MADAATKSYIYTHYSILAMNRSFMNIGHSALLVFVFIALLTTSSRSAFGQDTTSETAGDKDYLLVIFDSANIIAVLGIGAGFAVWWIDLKRQARDLRKKAYSTISWELDDIEETLSNPRYTKMEMKDSALKNKKHEKENDKAEDRTISFVNAFLFDEAYSSLINSGSFVQLNKRVQFLLAELYARVKRHNDFLVRIYELRDENIENNKVVLDKLSKRYYKYMEKTQQEIMERLPKIRQEIHRELPQREGRPDFK